MSFDLAAWSAPRIARVNDALDRFTPRANEWPRRLHEAMRYCLLAGGKRLRPLLCLAGAEAVGDPSERVLPMACALEMIHAFSLIHDDLPALDDDDLRRGQPTCHVRFGEATAILAGDALHSLAFETLAAHQPGAPEAVLDCAQRLASACGRMVVGQVADLESEGQEIDATTLRAIHAGKTGALLAASVQTGAILAGAPAIQKDALGRYGRQIGIAFQIVDDILDVTGTPEQIGKPAGSDEKRAKATYPRLFGLDQSRHLAAEALAEALTAIETFGPEAEPLRALARFVVERNL